MKRLIKKSEIYDGINDKLMGQYYEIYKNPTDREIAEIRKQDKDGIRGVIYSDGTIYAWGAAILHDSLNADIQNPLDMNQFRFAAENGYWFIDAHHKYTLDQTIELINKYQDKLSKFGNINGNWDIVFTSDKNDDNIPGNEILKTADLKVNPVSIITPNNNDNQTQIKDLRKKQNVPNGFQNLLDNEMEKIKNSDNVKTSRKRLIKKSEICDGFKADNGDYNEVYKNPTDREIAEIKKQDMYHSIRGVIYPDGTIYAWPGTKLHDEINSKISTKIDVDTFRFAYEGKNWIIDAHGKWNEDETKLMINQNINILSRFGDINAKFDLYYGRGYSMAEYQYAV